VTATAYLIKASSADARAARCMTRSGGAAWREIARHRRLLAAMTDGLHD
jgi:hypothetical protein